jgi:hypothetical protein
MTLPPEAVHGRLPLKGAPLTARQSRLRGGSGMAPVLASAIRLTEEI